LPSGAGGGFVTIKVVVALVIIFCVWRCHKVHRVYYRGIEGPTFGRYKHLPDEENENHNKKVLL